MISEMSSQADTVDMAGFYGTPEQKQVFCETLVDMLKQKGCIKVQSHTIPEDMIHELFEWTRKFFNLSHDEKMKVRHPPQANPNRGYSYVGQENVAGISGFEKGLGPGKTKDVKETYDMGSSTDTLVENIWIEEESLPGFRTFMEAFYNEAFKTEMELLSAIAIALGVSEEHLRSLHNKAENEFRLLHYPEVPASALADGTSTRIAEHTDFGTLTLLFQDSTGGLQVENQDQHGTFHDVVSSAATDIIINIGDSLQRLTNDTFRAACHRVTYPPSIQAGDDKVIPERYSVAYFGKPNRAASLLPLKEFVTAATPCRYEEDVTAWEWNNRRIVKLFS
ncbi:putative Fe2OG dioxygenase domain-containing protein [Seiridium cardinale]